MCDCYDNMPVVYEEAEVRGRKDYTCCECLDPIPKGTLHLRISGCWPDDGWETFRKCLECAEWVRHYREHYKDNCDCICLTELCDALHEYERDLEDPLLSCSLRAWQERRQRNYLRLLEERKRAKEVV